MKHIILAGGCFWCVEHDLKALPGVVEAVSGYSHASPKAAHGTRVPSYEDHEGYREAVRVAYDESQVTFKKLCQFFLDHIDPTDSGGQFYDRGESYRTAIYYNDDDEKKVAESLVRELEDSGLFAPLPIAVQVLPETTFYRAEDYHQDYAEKNPLRYASYARGSGRVQFVAQTCDAREQKRIRWKD